MKNEFERSERLLGTEAMHRLWQSHVAVFGLGGVGGHCAEALVRSGIGRLTLVDHDVVSLSNLNRQLLATHDTIGRKKVEVARERFLSISPRADIRAYDCFFLPENADFLDFTDFDYVVDAIDTVAGKIAIAKAAKEAGVPVIAVMGAGNKCDPTAFRVTDIYKTRMCPLARAVRSGLRKAGIHQLKVVYSEEAARDPLSSDEIPAPGKRQVPGSLSFVPSVAGLIAAGEVVCDLCNIKKQKL